MKILENLRAAAKKEWEKFQNSARVMVGAATCGRAAGAGAVMDEFKKVLKEKGLEDKVDVVETACIGLCYAEPLVEIKREGEPSILYSNVKPKDVIKLVGEHLLNGNPVAEKAEAIRRAEAKGLQVNRNKCHVIDLDKPFRFCKAKFQILPSGRIITHGCRDGMKRARRKMRYFRQQVDTGEKTMEQVAEWLEGPIAYYEQFNDHGRVLKLRRLYYALFIKGRKTEEVKPCIGS